VSNATSILGQGGANVKRDYLIAVLLAMTVWAARAGKFYSLDLEKVKDRLKISNSLLTNQKPYGIILIKGLKFLTTNLISLTKR
jgi:hypothetical protein